MNKFEKISLYKDIDLVEPVRKTKKSAGYDMAAAEDIVIPPYKHQYSIMVESSWYGTKTLEEMTEMTKSCKAKPTLIPTGYKCHIDDGWYLQLSVRSSSPLKYWIILANGVGIIDGDYCDNPDNEGHIYFQVINLSPFPIEIKKGDLIGQATFLPYGITTDDVSEGERVGGFGSTNA